jgi:hypothetical protein
MRWDRHIVHTEERITDYKILVVKTEAKRPLGKWRRRWEDNIRMDLKKIWWKIVNWIHLSQDRN